jgi:hypothetical protein
MLSRRDTTRGDAMTARQRCEEVPRLIDEVLRADARAAISAPPAPPAS